MCKVRGFLDKLCKTMYDNWVQMFKKLVRQFICLMNERRLYVENRFVVSLAGRIMFGIHEVRRFFEDTKVQSVLKKCNGNGKLQMLEKLITLNSCEYKQLPLSMNKIGLVNSDLLYLYITQAAIEFILCTEADGNIRLAICQLLENEEWWESVEEACVMAQKSSQSVLVNVPYEECNGQRNLLN